MDKSQPSPATKLRLDYGQPISLKQLEQIQTPLQPVKLIGWETGESLIAKPSSRSDWTLVFASNSSLTARVFSCIEAYAFKTSILCIHHDPFDHFHLVYPKNFQSIRVRVAPRISVDMEASLMTKDQKIMAVKIINFSRTGMGILGPHKLAGTGDHLQMDFDITTTEKSYSFSEEVVVRNTRLSGNNPSESIFGLEFITLDPTKATILSAYLYEQA